MSEPGKQSTENAVKKGAIALMGRFDRTLDPKKRLTIPSVWRDALGPDCVYVMPDTQRPCLQLIPKDMMESRLDELKKQPISSAELNALLDAIGENSEMLEFDVQGRIRISDRLLAYAKLKGAVVMKGAVRMATIWPAEETPAESAVDVAKLGAAMAKLQF